MSVNPLRPLARLLIGSTFAVLGWDAAREPGGRVEVAAGTLAALRGVVPLPRDDEVIVRGNGVAQAVGGAMLAAGVLTRPAAAVLALSLIPTTVAGHDFWNVDEPGARKNQRVQFHKNLAMLGGLLFVVAEDGKRH
ncbi:DoxX family protein [Nocardia sp. NPDC003482]|uniref:DoxX family protein n=1 Tax=Nocardia sp. NPDC004068 TaxID=3364303 RepID=UPI0036B9883E